VTPRINLATVTVSESDNDEPIRLEPVSTVNNTLRSLPRTSPKEEQKEQKFPQLELSTQPKFFLWSDPTNNTAADESLQTIYNQLRNDEVDYYPPGDYISKQAYVRPQMRGELVNSLFAM